MADDDLGLDEGSDDSNNATPKKASGLGTLLPKLLKWVAIIIGGIILIVTVVVVVVSFMMKNNAAVSAVPVSADYSVKREVLDWYSSLGSIRTKTCDIPPANVVVDVVLGYKAQDKTTSTEITQRQIEIKDFLRRYYTEKTAEDLKPQNEEKRRTEIREYINSNILTQSKIKDVRFLTLDVIEQ